MYQLTHQEGQRLTDCMISMRPDWKKNNPGQLLADANTTGLPGHDFGHALRALATYATTRGDDGKPQYRTPNLYVQDGKYWTTTAPTDWARPKAPECPDHTGQEGPTCRSCWADIKIGIRPETLLGKPLTRNAAHQAEMNGQTP